jgi:hypothetical protein
MIQVYWAVRCKARPCFYRAFYPFLSVGTKNQFIYNNLLFK